MQMVLPRSQVKEVLQEIHSGRTGAHLGLNKTINKVRDRFYWVRCKEDVTNYIQQCTICASVNGPSTRSRGPLQQYLVGIPFERIAMDVVGPFPSSIKGNRFILVIMDYFSKWPEAYPIPNQEATTVADVFVENWISRFGVPEEIHSDQGRNFESNVFGEMCSKLGIHKTRTTPLHPQSDGMVERFNRTIKEYLAKVIGTNQKCWDTHLQLFLMAYRTAEHRSTKTSPSKIIFGRNIRLPCDILFGVKPEAEQCLTDYVVCLEKKMADIHNSARSSLKINSNNMKARYDKKSNSSGFQPNEQVWLFNPSRKKGTCSKLTPKWEGPYKIVDRINDVVYRIQKSVKHKFKIVHLDRLAPFSGSNRDDS